MVNQIIFESLVKRARKWLETYKHRKPVHFTFILDGGRVVSMGINNRRKTHPDSPHPHKSVHSELDAILNINISDECKRYHFHNVAEMVHRLELVNIRIMKDGSVGLSLPCQYCQKLISMFSFKGVYWTDVNGKLCGQDMGHKYSCN